MTLAWSQFGLAEPDATDRDRLVLLGGGVGRVVPVRWTQSWRGGSFDDRFHVTQSRIPLGDDPPRAGDIVLWRGYDPAAPEEASMWGAPTRVLDVETSDTRIDVWSLEDADLTDRTPENIDDVDHHRARQAHRGRAVVRTGQLAAVRTLPALRR